MPAQFLNTPSGKRLSMILIVLLCTHFLTAQTSTHLDDMKSGKRYVTDPDDVTAYDFFFGKHKRDHKPTPEELDYYHIWNWTTWWEANSHRYLKPAKWSSQDQDTTTQPEGYQIAQMALLKALQEKKHPEIMAQIIWALGRMKSTTATPSIVKLLKHDDAMVRRNAWLSLGLIEDELAVQTIMGVLDKPDLKQEDTAAWIVAIGLMDKPDPKLLKVLIPIIKQKNITQTLNELPSLTNCYRNEATFKARMAMWTLRMHNPPGTSEFAQKLIPFTTDPILFDEAIQAIAAATDEKIIRELFNPVYHSRLTDYLKLPRAFSIDAYGAHHMQYISVALAPDFPNALPSLRTSAAIAYDHPAIRNNSHNGRLIYLTISQLARSYSLIQGQGYSSINGQIPIKQTYKYDSWGRYRSRYGSRYIGDDIGFALRFGLIPLGNLGDYGLDKRDRFGSSPPIDNKFDPSRGFAAIALGLYTRRLPADLSSIRHDKTKDIGKYIERLLTRTAKNSDEPMMLRSACALALGIGGSQSANDRLVEILTDKPPAIVSSYAILALGMLGDQRTPKLVHQAFEKTADQIDVDKIRKTCPFIKENNLKTLSQRVMVQSLASIGNPQANRMLYPYLADNLYTSHQIIRTLKWSGDTLATESLVELLDKPGKKNPTELAAFSAWALGELFDPNPFSKAHERLLKNRNYTLILAEYNTVNINGLDKVARMTYKRQDHLRQYLQLSNQYFFEAMTPFPWWRR